MKIINATWEKRNLGVTCQEVELDLSDSIQHLDTALEQLNSEYQVIKLPCGKPELLLYLQSRGFEFIEVMTSCYHEGRLPTMNGLQNRLLVHLSCVEASNKELSMIFDQIHSGMFATDRVAIDPRFGPEFAARRYVGWIDDEIGRGAIVYQIAFKKLRIGFFVLGSQKDDEWSAILGGIYPSYQNIGFGLLMNYLEVSKGIEKGAKRVYSAFSSNNTAASSIHFALGYQITNQKYILTRHLALVS